MSSSADKSSNIEIKKKKNVPVRSIFMHADAVDKFLMTLGLLGAVGDGFSSRLLIVFNSSLMNNMGSGGASDKVSLFSSILSHTQPVISLGFLILCAYITDTHKC